MRRVISIVVCILLIAMLLLNVVLHVTNQRILKEPFINNVIDKSGIYDYTNQKVDSYVKTMIEQTMRSNNIGDSLSTWVWDSTRSVFNETYIQEFVRLNIRSGVAYVLNKQDTLAQFDLTSKYQQLKMVMAEQLTLEIVQNIPSLKKMGIFKIFEVMGVEIKIDESIKYSMVEYILGQNQMVNKVFAVSSTEQMLALAEQPQVLVGIDKLRTYVELIRRVGKYPLYVAIDLLILMILINLKRLKDCFKMLGVSLVIAMIISAVCAIGLLISGDVILRLLDGITLNVDFTIQPYAITMVLQKLSRSMLVYCIYYILVACVFLLLSRYIKSTNEDEMIAKHRKY